MADGPPETEKRSRRSFWMALAILAGVVVYAYGFQVTKVNLDEIKSETRRAGLIRILRDMARPDLIEYDQDRTNTDLAVQVPCAEADSASALAAGPIVVMDPPCGDPRQVVTVTGTGFSPNQQVLLQFIPTSGVQLRLGTVRTDDSGGFTIEVRLPARPDPAAQTLRVVSTEPVGSPRFTETARQTWAGIVETVFLALIATTFGTLLSIPLGFFAARNIMKDVSLPLTNVALAIIGFPIGVVAGILVARSAARTADRLTTNTLLTVIGLVLIPILSWWLVRRALPPEEITPPPRSERTLRALLLIMATMAAVLSLYLAAELLQEAGNWLQPRLGTFGFLGGFLTTLGELAEVGIGVFSALFGGGVLLMVLNRIGHGLRRVLPPRVLAVLDIPLAMLAGTVLLVLVGRTIAWFYQWRDLNRTLWYPALVGTVIGLALALRARRKESVGVGLGIYYTARTVFNVLRAIEPLIMAIVFVVWVGLGPFAGALALALHTVASLSKLYSEQVESIVPGPSEAIRSTGATRLQNVMYAVFPQVIPPYVSFTMYRWDINVRMSTIIGFVGGGGIGLILQQNINLLNYRAAAAQMFAIAIVVSSMDWLSSKIREHYV